MEKNIIGKVFCFNLFYLVVRKHPDDELYFLVPGDKKSDLVGICDVHSGDWVWRCGSGLWAHRDEIPKEWCDEDELAVVKCRKVLHWMVAGGKYSYTDAQLAADETEAYEEHLAVVNKQVDELRTLFRQLWL